MRTQVRRHFLVTFASALLTAVIVFVNSDAFASDAQDVTAALTSQGYACTQTSLKTGESSYRCRGKVPSYSKPVNVYVPGAFTKNEPFSLAYHFIGFWTSAAYDPFTSVNGDYGSYLAASGQNALLIVPESAGADSTYITDLNTPDKLNRFFDGVDGVLARSDVRQDDQTDVVLSGHSGAYVALGLFGDWASKNLIPTFKRLHGFALFDSAYGPRTGLVSVLEAMRANGSAAYFIAYNPTNSSSKNTTILQLQKQLGAPERTNSGEADIQIVKDSKSAHMEFMRRYMTTFFKFAIR